MKLNSLLSALDDYEIFGPRGLEVSAITDDSRKLSSGALFVAIPGLKIDAHKFIPKAISKGSVVVVGERKPQKAWLDKTTYIRVPSSRRALGLLASVWYGYPSRKLSVIGVTGTDGKTTTASIIHWILERTGKRAGLITTVSAKIGKKEEETGLHVTNPEPLKLQEFLARMVKKGCRYAVLEVTSHGLDQERVAGIDFDIGVLTNITHEHIDYHKSWQNYRRAKARLFERVKVAVLNKGDKSFAYISRFVPKKAKIISYSLKGEADYTSDDLAFLDELKPLSEYNQLNTLAAVAVARELGISAKQISAALASFRLPPGRLEKISQGQSFDVYIDFAHTPNALEKVLKFLKTKRKGRSISVFGSAGERDVAKREMMGKISARLSDISIFTAEDPRTENIHEILSKMAQGAKSAGAKEIIPHEYKGRSTKKQPLFARIPERGEAIAYALQKLAKKGDTVVIAGKGHEKSMSYEGVEHPWSDQTAARNVLQAKSDLCAIVLAAGRGTRMNSELPKVLHKIAGRPMISYTLENLRAALFGEIVVVIGYKQQEVMKTIGGAVNFAYQTKPLGTADATARGLKQISAKQNDIVVLNGDDSAFYRPETIKKVLKRHKESKAVLTFVTLVKKYPRGLGRILRDEKGKLLGIVEEKEATGAQKKIREVNDGLYVFNRDWVTKNLSKVERSAKSGEYYLVELVKMALDQKNKVTVFKLGDSDEWFGVNTKEQLALADKKMREKVARELV